jgi:hypothetical protein
MLRVAKAQQGDEKQTVKQVSKQPKPPVQKASVRCILDELLICGTVDYRVILRAKHPASQARISIGCFEFLKCQFISFSNFE